MKAGRELDELVTREVLGPDWAVRPYSTDIGAAWEVFTRNHEWVDIRWAGYDWYCSLKTPKPGTKAVGTEATADTAPLAICYAVLRALGHDIRLR